MSDFKAKMHKFDSRCGSAPDPAGAAYSAPPDLLAVFKELTSKWRDAEEEEGKKGEGKRRGKGKGRGQSPQTFWHRTAPADQCLQLS